jgi:hypothetical protein
MSFGTGLAMTTGFGADNDLPKPERRHPRVTTDVLRRHLRQADDDLYTARASMAAATNARTRTGIGRRGVVFGAVLFGAVAAATAVWAARGPSTTPQAGDIRVQVTTVRSPAIVRTDETRMNRALAVSVPAQQPPARALRRPTGARQVRAVPKAPRRHVPRPLSPGEFGRSATSRAN